MTERYILFNETKFYIIKQIKKGKVYLVTDDFSIT